ncbi:hypothetical protein KC887_01290 [Candidatus Kaiserbacteria bacterium]|nr:hypothetical protein [Candidatus Kaiserbacteria bacterium]
MVWKETARNDLGWKMIQLGDGYPKAIVSVRPDQIAYDIWVDSDASLGKVDCETEPEARCKAENALFNYLEVM